MLGAIVAAGIFIQIFRNKIQQCRIGNTGIGAESATDRFYSFAVDQSKIFRVFVIKSSKILGRPGVACHKVGHDVSAVSRPGDSKGIKDICFFCTFAGFGVDKFMGIGLGKHIVAQKPFEGSDLICHSLSHPQEGFLYGSLGGDRDRFLYCVIFPLFPGNKETDIAILFQNMVCSIQRTSGVAAYDIYFFCIYHNSKTVFFYFCIGKICFFYKIFIGKSPDVNIIESGGKFTAYGKFRSGDLV